jgi:glycosyltransferase involved in cell wall biosynthesis
VPSLTLGILATPASLDETINLCVETEELISEVIVALDASQSDVNFTQKLQAACGVPVTVIAHSLDGDFAAQRNRIQAASSSPWVLQLDTDERLTKAAKRRIPWLLAEAEVAGWQGFALPRQNVVDGVVSAHYPDVQYRLLRQDIRFVRRVHEYPNLPQGRSMLALGADILHYMASERLLHRERLYEKMMTGAGRPYDTALLQIPLGNEVRIPK